MENSVDINLFAFGAKKDHIVSNLNKPIFVRRERQRPHRRKTSRTPRYLLYSSQDARDDTLTLLRTLQLNGEIIEDLVKIQLRLWRIMQMLKHGRGP